MGKDSEMNKPVAWMKTLPDGTVYGFGQTKTSDEFDIPLYTHPVKELTDEEIMDELVKVKHTWVATTSVWFEFEKEEFTFPDEQVEKESASEIEFEIVDDTPEEDRNREPMPKAIVDELEQDDLTKYDEATKQKIGESLKGHKLSQETINKRIISRRINRTIQFDIEGNRLHSFDSCKEAAEYIGASLSNISSCCIGKAKTAKGYVWKYEPIIK